MHDATWAALRQLVDEHHRAERLRESGIEPTRSALFTVRLAWARPSPPS